MIETILNKLFLLLFFLACLNIIRHGYYFIQSYIISKTEDIEKPLKYRVRNSSLILLGISIAYIFTVIVTGIKI